jgi:hypothetical protein
MEWKTRDRRPLDRANGSAPQRDREEARGFAEVIPWRPVSAAGDLRAMPVRWKQRHMLLLLACSIIGAVFVIVSGPLIGPALAC